MVVKRIVTDIAVTRTADAIAFYVDLLGMQPVMDQGWILTLASEESAPPQISFATEGGSGTAVPDLSVEVDDVDVIHAKAETAGFEIVYGPVDEPWGVRRFYVRDPFGRVVNVLSHVESGNDGSSG